MPARPSSPSERSEVRKEQRRSASPRPQSETQVNGGHTSGAKGMETRAQKPTPLVVHYIIAASLVAAVLLGLFFVAGPYLMPALFESPEQEQSLMELLRCREEGLALRARLKLLKGKKEPEQQAKEDAALANMGDAAKNEEILRLREMVRLLLQDKQVVGQGMKMEEIVDGTGPPVAAKVSTEQALEGAKKLLEACHSEKPVVLEGPSSKLTSWKGYECGASAADLARYHRYTPGGLCPNDWYFVQRLMFKYNCFALPRRRCFSITPAKPSEPLPLPDSLFSQHGLKDENVRWDLHQCKSYECLNSRKQGDCLNCFNMELESHRWKEPFRGTIPMKEVVGFKKGSLRIGLDVGGGTGSFAAHMAKHGVTVMTTAFNVETVAGKNGGLPYMETIAQRGIIPLHWPHKARLPLYDGVLDIVHSVNSIKYIPAVEFEELIFEWNRVLRPGGLLWFEMFYAPVTEMTTYVAIIEQLGYKKLYWNYTPKPDTGERGGDHVYLNCVLEKQPTPGKEVLEAPPEEDMEQIV